MNVRQIEIMVPTSSRSSRNGFGGNVAAARVIRRYYPRDLLAAEQTRDGSHNVTGSFVRKIVENRKTTVKINKQRGTRRGIIR